MIKITEKKERTLGERLFLKGTRCDSPKCVTVRRPYAPGAHGKRRRGGSEFGEQLKEKQKFKFSYGLTEAQLEHVVNNAMRQKEVTGTKIMEFLERRLDNITARLGIALSRRMARQMIRDGHITVNGRKVTIPSFLVSIGDTIGIREESRSKAMFAAFKERAQTRTVPGWLMLNPEKSEGKVVSFSFDEEMPFNINLVVEYFSK